MTDATFPNATQRMGELRALQNVRPLTLEEAREAIRIMRGDRERAAAVSSTSRAKKTPINSDDLLKGLE